MAPSNGTRASAYDRAMALCPNDTARLELSRLGAELNIGVSSPEWIMVVLYAEARGIFGTPTDTDRADLFAQLARIESRMPKSAATQAEPIVTGRMRDLIVFTIALLTCVAIAAIVGVAQATPIGFIAAFALGLGAALFYVWVAPIVTRARHQS